MSLPVAITRFAAKASALAVKHAPTILTYTGVAAATAGTGLAIKQSFRYMEKVSEPDLEHLVKIEETMDLSKAGKLLEEYTEQEYKRDKIHAYVLLGIHTVKHYAVPAALFVGGMAMILTGHHMQLKRLATLTAAYGTLQVAYSNLKDRIKKAGITNEEVKDLLKADVVFEDEQETGEVTRQVTSYQPYEYYFDETNEYFHANSQSANETFLESVLQFANDRLCARGHLFLNEVLEALGMEHTAEGAVTGWILDDEHDGIVEFGEEINYDVRLDQLDGIAPRYTLNFNVHGLIWDRI